MSGRPGQYYRAGHWVKRGSSASRPAVKSPGVTGAVVALLVLGAWLGLFSTDSSGTGAPAHQPTPSHSAPQGR